LETIINKIIISLVFFCVICFCFYTIYFVGFAGNSVVFEPAVIIFENNSPGETFTKSCRIQNNSSRPIKIIGTDACCECKIVAGIPGDAKVGEEAVIEIQFRSFSSEDDYRRVIEVYTDSPDFPVLQLEVQGSH